MLETPTLWEGRIQLTALVALFRNVDDAFAYPECLSTVPALESPWRMGGLVLTDLMLYIVCVAHAEEHADETDSRHAAGSGGAEDMLAGGGVHVELEDVVDSITSLDVYDRSGAAGVHPMVVLKVNTFTHELAFVPLSEEVFDNVGVGEVVHHFGILPGVVVRHHVYTAVNPHASSPPVKPALRKAASPSQLGAAAPRTPLCPAFDSVSPVRAVGHGQELLVALMTALEAEGALRLSIDRDEASQRLAATAALGNALLAAQLEWQRRLMADIKALNTNIFIDDSSLHDDDSSPGPAVSLLERPASDAVRQLLETQERLVRVRTEKYLHSMRAVRESRRHSERIADLAHAKETEQRLQQQLAERDEQLRTMSATVQALQASRVALESELNDFKRREATVIEKARRREADLHAQLESVKRSLYAADGSGVASFGGALEASPGSDGSPLPPPPLPPANFGGKFGTPKFQMFGRQAAA